MKLWVYKCIAVLSLLLAFAGVLLPGLPATEFVILSAWAAAKGSPTIYRFIMSRPYFRDMIENWQNGRVISRKNKIISAISMSICFLILWVHHVALWVMIVATAGMLIATVIIWRRPEIRPSASPSSVSSSEAE
ncbi:YbaN family protein [Vibrio porteresiae]|uniref:Inner membrane protein n=1 Tax=Vibrio porteresiae DSM 19223 TaxID=1123496 RepID=A0ABZ0QC95_9VIBR|nr:YbaN family protein [Vibrio porteresiae]WPC74066.1 YbaN family protein [Vibrio porteresiae DSM 19223]